jgi:hypothetical protein
MLTIQPFSNWTKDWSNPNLVSGTLHLTSTIVYPLSIAVANGNPPIGRVNKDNQEDW